MFKYLFGPVPSRRLGMSLGVDLVPKKVCSLDCIYCEVGQTTKLTTERKEYIRYPSLIKELSAYFSNNPDPDYITFSGSGEPTLNSRIGDVISFIKEKKPHIPIAVLTNGTLLNDKQVRRELLEASVVLPSLDVATNLTFQKINRPELNLSITRYIQGLVNFRSEYQGEIWLEILIIPGINDNLRDLNALKEAIIRIQPDRIQLNTLDRPGAIADIRAASMNELQQIVKYWNLAPVEIIAAATKRKNLKAYRRDTEEAILETISRRPCTIDDLQKILGLHINEINKYLDTLEGEGKVQPQWQNRGLFYHSQ
ncbi:MAG: radical SAM protein [Bacteroidetes bacterium]|jgi:wyosine [tRNA(Phe)-imidazoG37] synthetase (radical SAM superfamily)|nr:radical SAM protein [Bacteroidota bacterium]MBT4399048.1 radical SAM protein [Bacteroidota bacterium]MBT4408490.1 radical SAM protein [Bacteroidota bacterium]MBT5427015.1 radical SAM protein [Bacteroidota bacterium]MBT7092763.1 radical SAM protein [Bacteroidota bacterium]